MPPKSRKRKNNENQTSPQRDEEGSDAGANVIGGMRGDYRITGAESSPDYEIFTIPDETGKDIPCQYRKPSSSFTSDTTTLIFTHGAGGGLENPATKLFAEGYATQAPAVCFQGTMNLQSRTKSFGSVLSHLQKESPERKFAVGGRSMGARAAVLLAQLHDEIKKLVLVSYPLTGQKGDTRDQILLDLPKEKEVLFLTGSEDKMCEIKKLQGIQKKMKAKSTLLIFDKLDHGMAVTGGISTKDRPHATEELRKYSGEQAASWINTSASIKDGTHVEWGNAEKKVLMKKDNNKLETMFKKQQSKQEETADKVSEQKPGNEDAEPAKSNKRRRRA